METYNIVRIEGGWGISQNKNKPEGSYATREGAFEAVYLAASNDIKKVAASLLPLNLTGLTNPPWMGRHEHGGSLREEDFMPDHITPEYKEANRRTGPNQENTERARAGVTGHNVRYVLGFGLLAVIIAFAIVYLIYFH
jgi:hypothetical protein